MSWKTRIAKLVGEFGEGVVNRISKTLADDATLAEARAAAKAAQSPLAVPKKTPPKPNLAAKTVKPNRISGAPQNITTKRQETAARKRYADTVKKGVQGALWYDDSGKAIMSHVGDRPEKARPVAANFAVTSSSTGVKGNTGFAVKGHNQAISGDPVVTGRFPTQMGPEVAAAYSKDAGAAGLKRGPFEQQLAIGGGFAEPGTDPRAVHDIWDGRAWGYTNPNGSLFSGSFSPAQHRWQDEQLQKVIPTLPAQPFPWTTGRVQAAGWSGAKINAGEIKPDEAAYSYADDFPRHYAQGSRETVFGSNTGIMPELSDASAEARRELDERVASILYDDKGRDRIALGFGALTGPHFKAPGVYEGVISPGRQAQYAVGVQTVTPEMATEMLPQGKAIDPSSLNLMKGIEGTYGMLTGQKAIAGNKFFSDVPAGSRNSFELNKGSPMSDEDALLLSDLQKRLGIDPDSTAIVASPQGVRLPNFGVDPALLKKYAVEGANELGAEKPVGGFFHGMYEENPWERPEGRYGQSYLNLIGERPAYLKSFDDTAPELAGQLREMYRQFAKEHGYTLPEYYDELLGAVAGGGEAGLRELIKRRRFAEGGLAENDLSHAVMKMAEHYGLA